MASVIKDLESFGAGIFVTHQGVDTRLSESDLWRAFEEPVIVWSHEKSFDDLDVERLIEILKKLPRIQGFRFTSAKISAENVRRLRDFWPEVSIEGAAA
jgi:hypothetical protein